MVTMVVATYNVHRCVGADGRADVERVAAVIRELSADVVGLQEVACAHDPGGASQLDRLASATGRVAVAGPTLHRAGATYGNGVLLRTAPARVRRLDLGVAGREPRGALAVTLPGAHPGCRVVVTHLGLRVAERRAQVDRLIAFLADDDGPGAPLVLLGDFNDWTVRPRALRRLERHVGPSTPVRSFPARWPALALDRILVRAPVHLGGVRAHASALARRASDHLPVRGVVALSGTTGAASD
jgi:endonuclease/exonuclease/phosphatase family metal-dependent hydrolase